MPRPDKLRVVTFLDTLVTGGAERMAVTIAARLDPERFESTVCVYKPSRQAPLASGLEAAAIPVLHLNRSHQAALWNWKPLLQLLRQERTHVLHSHKTGPNVWGTMLGRIAGVPVVVAHDHAGGPDRTRMRHVIDRELIGRGADAFVTVSEAHRTSMIDVEGIQPDKVRVIRNGIERLRPATTDLRRDLGLSANAPVVGTIAVLRPEKALEVLIEAAGLLAPRFPSLRVLIAGSGPEEHRLRDLVRRLRLEETVCLLGFREDIADVLAALDVAVFTSDREGMPLAMIEAMAAGRPIVATRIEGIPELVTDGEEALLVPPRHPKALAEAVARLLEDRDLRDRLGARAQERQRRELDIQTTVQAFQDLYDELFAKSRRRRRPPSESSLSHQS